jgi:hypothetical protein
VKNQFEYRAFPNETGQVEIMQFAQEKKYSKSKLYNTVTVTGRFT